MPDNQTTQLSTSKRPVLDRPQLAEIKSGKNWQGKAENFGLQLACTGRGSLANESRPSWPGSNYRACIQGQDLP